MSSAMIHHCFGGKDGLRQAVIDTMYCQLGGLDRRAQTMIGLMVLLSRLQRCSFRHLPWQIPHSRLALERSELTILGHSFRSTV
ncbi:MAG: hypothetical protein GY811_17005 [Myxococcales bacterium]|nr:hypothetical protein [Myxococcales bacterium]